jgi:hypothetical protein
MFQPTVHHTVAADTFVSATTNGTSVVPDIAVSHTIAANACVIATTNIAFVLDRTTRSDIVAIEADVPVAVL